MLFNLGSSSLVWVVICVFFEKCAVTDWKILQQHTDNCYEHAKNRIRKCSTL